MFLIAGEVGLKILVHAAKCMNEEVKDKLHLYFPQIFVSVSTLINFEI